MLGWIEAHPGLAGWVQAFFTVITVIVGVIWFPLAEGYRRKKEREEDLRRADEERRRRQTIMAGRLKGPLRHAWFAFDEASSKPKAVAIRSLNRAKFLLDEVPTLELSDSCAECVNEIRYWTQYIAELLDQDADCASDEIEFALHEVSICITEIYEDSPSSKDVEVDGHAFGAISAYQAAHFDAPTQDAAKVSSSLDGRSPTGAHS